MYDDIIGNVVYSLGFDFDFVSEAIFNFCSSYGLAFSSILGFAIGVKFLKQAFN